MGTTKKVLCPVCEGRLRVEVTDAPTWSSQDSREVNCPRCGGSGEVAACACGAVLETQAELDFAACEDCFCEITDCSPDEFVRAKVSRATREKLWARARLGKGAAHKASALRSAS